ncbi:hypothetical protein A1Q2_00281 [Trichosporon asahii var. asahii CBS 8904]|uniref:Uncharacterized protein n=1 Tax=Trichosporon asahii var. asahii (strain CBS 8904) TaxID=1220162 RepID=K1VMU2_TRIAC|nr:hypothetical protein A1Q2_00281 [Trichosporon asahii var. asahii CBS 8904]
MSKVCFLARYPADPVSVSTSTSILPSTARSQSENDVEWPPGVSRFDWAMTPGQTWDLYGHAVLELPPPEAARVLALHHHMPPTPATVYIKDTSPLSASGPVPYTVCVGTRDEHVHGRRARRALWQRPSPTSADIYDALLPWTTPRYVNSSDYVFEDCSVSSDETTLLDVDWDDHPADDSVYGWCATIVFASESHYMKARKGCAGEICGWKIIWKKEEDDDSELEEEGSSGSASVDTTLVTPETQTSATVPSARVPGSGAAEDEETKPAGVA